MNDLPPEGLPDALVPEADPEDRNTVRKGADRVEGDPGVVGSARSGGDDDSRRALRDQLGDGNRVVSEDADVRPELAPPSSTPIARKRILALLRISSHSFSGSESATIPAPAWITASPSRITIVRIVMQKSMLPWRSKYPTAPA
jgi:hypothetical protein